MCKSNNLHLYYFVVRRYPPKSTLSGAELDHYCSRCLQSPALLDRIEQDYKSFFPDDKDIYNHSWLDFE